MIKVKTDKLLGYDKATLPDSELALFRFHDDERIFIGRADERNGSLRPVSNDEFRYAGSRAEFERKVNEFVRRSAS